MHEAGSRWCRLRRVVALLQHREHFRQPVVDYINPDCLVSKCIEEEDGNAEKCVDSESVHAGCLLPRVAPHVLKVRFQNHYDRVASYAASLEQSSMN